MPEVTYTTRVNAPVDDIWGFVRDMNNWAPMLTGYQQHEIKGDRQSIWTLRGDVGILSRTVRLEVNITEWAGPQRVAFTLKGLNEAVEGDGAFEMIPTGEADAASAAVGMAAARRPPLLLRWLRWVFAALFRRKYGTVERASPSGAPGAPQDAGPTSVLTFRLRMDAGGPTGPLVNAMLEPALLPATEDLGNKIAAHLEREVSYGAARR